MLISKNDEICYYFKEILTDTNAATNHCRILPDPTDSNGLGPSPVMTMK